MSDTRLRSVCATMKHFIEMTEAELARFRIDIRDAERALEQARARQPPNPELIEALEQRLPRLQQDRDNARNALQVLQEEFSAQCL